MAAQGSLYSLYEWIGLIVYGLGIAGMLGIVYIIARLMKHD